MKAPVAILFANLKGNIGDFAILHAMLLALKDRFSGHSLHVFSHGFHEIDQARLSAFRACAPEFELVGTTYVPGIEGSLVRFLPFVRHRPFVQVGQIWSLTARSGRRAACFRNYEAVFLAGGAHWSGTKVGVSMFGTLRAVHRHNDRIYTFPFSVNPTLQKYNSRRALQQYFSLIREPLIVRDGITKRVMEGLGIPAVLGADCVFLLRDLADRIEPIPGRDRSRIVFVLTGQPRKELAAALRRLGRPAREIALLTTCEVEDGQVLQAVSRELRFSYHAPATWQETVAELKASSLVVTNRLHGAILGCFAKTPLLPVADRKKVEAFAVDAGLPHSAAGIRSLTGELIRQCLIDREVILERMARYSSRSRREALTPLVPAEQPSHGT